MKNLHICTGWVSQSLCILDDAIADAAMLALTDAMNAHDRYGNDKTKTVTISLGPSSGATFRIENLVSVLVEDYVLAESTTMERKVFEETTKAKLAARLAPPTQP